MLPWTSHNYYVFLVHVCSLSYPARNAHVPNCHLWSVPYFSTVSYKTARFSGGGKLLNKNCVLILFTAFVRNIRILRRIRPRYYHNYTYVFMQSTSYSCQILMQVDFLTIFQKSSNIKFHENMSSRSRVVPCGRTDRQT